eukprot:4764332-Prymnesium_polylepis.1
MCLRFAIGERRNTHKPLCDGTRGKSHSIPSSFRLVAHPHVWANTRIYKYPVAYACITKRADGLRGQAPSYTVICTNNKGSDRSRRGGAARTRLDAYT